ncbi:sedoheptulokinase [Alicyclobacillus fodiniaquatilis]|uniref:Sedoheptulokinase n=1 Tax=Alicyclobacillus fodiniaquatilis TaxID=1661150 RepID=A0ABW4JJT6_9BACL
MKLIGLDIGTTSICGVMLDAETGHVLDKMTKPNDSTIFTEEHFARCQDATAILDVVEEILHDLVKRDTDIAAIGISTQMHGILYVNALGAPVSPLYTWQDGRGDLPYGDGRTYCDVFTELTGYPIATGYGLVTHFYNVVNHMAPSNAASLCTIGDYVAMKLAQQTRPVTDVTNAASLGAFELQKGRFDVLRLAAVGIQADILPEVVPCGHRVGETVQHIPVFSALGDNQASFLGAVPSADDTLLINVGTGAQVSLLSDDFIQAPHFETRPFPGNQFLLVGATLSGGKAYARLEQFFREVVTLFGDDAPASLYSKMSDVLDRTPTAVESLEVTPWFYGTRENPQARGSIQNISTDNFTPAHLMVGVLEGIVHDLAAYHQHLPQALRQRIRQLVGSGNGIRKNAHLAAMIERQFGKGMRLSANEEEASVGAALCAGVGSGVFSSFAAASAMLSFQS